MKRVFVLFVLLSLSLLMGASVRRGPAQAVSEAPTGSCTSYEVRVVNGETPGVDEGKHYCCESGTWTNCDIGGAAGNPGGAETYVQFYDTGSVFGGESTLVYIKGTNQLTCEDLSVTGEIVTDMLFDDGTTDSPKISFDVPSESHTWSIYHSDSAGKLELYTSSSTDEIVNLSNAGAGDVDLVCDGDTTIGKNLTVTGQVVADLEFNDGVTDSPAAWFNTPGQAHNWNIYMEDSGSGDFVLETTDNSDRQIRFVNLGSGDTALDVSGGVAVGGNADVVGYVASDTTVYIGEQAAAQGDEAGYGQWWSKNTATQQPMYTPDSGADFQLLSQPPSTFNCAWDWDGDGDITDDAGDLLACLDASQAALTTAEDNTDNAVYVLLSDGYFDFCALGSSPCPYTIKPGTNIQGVRPRYTDVAEDAQDLDIRPNGGTWIDGDGASSSGGVFDGSQLRGVSFRDIGFYNYEDALVFGPRPGTHTGGNGAALLTDSAANFAVDALIGAGVYNVTDLSKCTITDNDETTITCTLLANDGVCDTEDCDWDTSDEYSVSVDGVAFSDFDHISCVGQSSGTDSCVWLTNMQHVRLNHVTAFKCDQCFRFTQAHDLIQYGNSVITDLYAYTYQTATSDTVGLWLQCAYTGDAPSELLNYMTIIRPQVNSFEATGLGTNIWLDGETNCTVNSATLIGTDTEGTTDAYVRMENVASSQIEMAGSSSVADVGVWIDSTSSQNVLTAMGRQTATSAMAAGANLFFGNWDDALGDDDYTGITTDLNNGTKTQLAAHAIRTNATTAADVNTTTWYLSSTVSTDIDEPDGPDLTALFARTVATPGSTVSVNFDPLGIVGQLLFSDSAVGDTGTSPTYDDATVIEASTTIDTDNTGTIIDDLVYFKAWHKGGTGSNTTVNRLDLFKAQIPSFASSVTYGTFRGLRIDDLRGIGTTNRAISVDAQDENPSADKGNIVMEGGAWNTGHLELGSTHLWESAAGTFYLKNGAPSTATNGYQILTGEVDGSFNLDGDLTVGDGTAGDKTITLNGDGTDPVLRYNDTTDELDVEVADVNFEQDVYVEGDLHAEGEFEVAIGTCVQSHSTWGTGFSTSATSYMSGQNYGDASAHCGVTETTDACENRLISYYGQRFFNFYVKVDSAPGAVSSGNAWDITFRADATDSGAPGDITCQIFEDATSCNDTSNYYGASAGEKITWKIVPTSTPNSPGTMQIRFCSGPGPTL